MPNRSECDLFIPHKNMTGADANRLAQQVNQDMRTIERWAQRFYRECLPAPGGLTWATVDTFDSSDNVSDHLNWDTFKGNGGNITSGELELIAGVWMFTGWAEVRLDDATLTDGNVEFILVPDSWGGEIRGTHRPDTDTITPASNKDIAVSVGGWLQLDTDDVVHASFTGNNYGTSRIIFAQIAAVRLGDAEAGPGC